MTFLHFFVFVIREISRSQASSTSSFLEFNRSRRFFFEMMTFVTNYSIQSRLQIGLNPGRLTLQANTTWTAEVARLGDLNPARTKMVYWTILQDPYVDVR